MLNDRFVDRTDIIGSTVLHESKIFTAILPHIFVERAMLGLPQLRIILHDAKRVRTRAIEIKKHF